jgi:hypothetical protein
MLADRILAMVKDLRVENGMGYDGFRYLQAELPYERTNIYVVGSSEPVKEMCVSATHSTIRVYKTDTIIPFYHVLYDDAEVLELKKDARKIYKAFEKRHNELQGLIYASKIQRLKSTLGLV